MLNVSYKLKTDVCKIALNLSKLSVDEIPKSSLTVYVCLQITVLNEVQNI